MNLPLIASAPEKPAHSGTHNSPRRQKRSRSTSPTIVPKLYEEPKRPRSVCGADATDQPKRKSPPPMPNYTPKNPLPKTARKSTHRLGIYTFHGKYLNNNVTLYGRFIGT